MHNTDLARSLHEQRLRESRMRRGGSRMVAAARGHRPRRSLRRSLGRTVVRIGLAIEAEPRQPIASS
jgi:hypothetical protein